MSARYWPSKGTLEYDLMSVTMQDEKLFSEYAIRKFLLTNKKVNAIMLPLYHKACAGTM